VGYYEVKYTTSSGSTRTTSGKNLSNVKSRLEDKGYTVVSSKYVSTSSKSSSSSRASLSMVEKKGMSNNNKKSNKTEDVFYPPRIGREFGTVTDVAEQTGKGYGTSIVPDENKYRIVPEDVAKSASVDSGRVSSVSSTGKYRGGGSSSVTTGGSTHSKPKPDDTISITEFRQRLRKPVIDLRKTGKRLIDFDPNTPVTIDGKIYPGADVLYSVTENGTTKTLSASEYDFYLDTLGKSYISDAKQFELEYRDLLHSTYDWYPDTRIREIKTDTGYEYKPIFSFEGAEKYYTYKSMLESDPGRATALGWGWGGYGNIDIAFYKLTGQNEKALQTNIARLSRYMSAKESLAKGDIGGFSAKYWSGYLSMPSTQIGLSFVGGQSLGQFLTTKSTVAAATTGKTISSTFAKVLMGGAAGGIVTYKGYTTVTELKRTGDVGKALGESWLFGTSAAAGIAGFQTGQKTGRIIAEQKIQEYFKAHPEKIRMYHYYMGERQGYKISGRYEGRFGTPIERQKVSLKFNEIYTPGSKSVARTFKYRPGLQEFKTIRGFETGKINLRMNTLTGTETTAKLDMNMASLRKIVFDIPSKNSIRRITTWSSDVTRTGLPLGGITKTVNIPISSNIPVSGEVLFPVTSFIPASTSIGVSTGISTGLGELGRSKPHFDIYKPSFKIYKPSFSSPIISETTASSVINKTDTVFDSYVGQTTNITPITSTAMAQDVLFKNDQRQISILKPLISNIKPPKPPLFKKDIIGFPAIWPRRKFHLGGGTSSLGSFLGKGYRYRKWKVPTLNSFLKKWR